MYVYVKVYNHGNDLIIAICDEELLGSVFKEGDVILDVSRDFFGGSKMLIEDSIQLLNDASSAILVGSNIVSKALEAGYIHPDAISRVSEVPYAHIIKLS